MPDLTKHIQKVLDISISHITAKDNGLLHSNAGDLAEFPVTILEYQFGYLLSAWHHGNTQEPEEIEEFEKNFLEVGFSKELLALLKLAGEADCLWLQVDRDRDVLDGIPVFQW